MAEQPVLSTDPTCPSCGGEVSEQFYEVRGVPTQQVRLVRSRGDALACTTGDIALRFCGGCGFVWNAAFDPTLVEYEDDYESTQASSPTFNRFHDRLARELVERFDLHGKVVVEVGCGQGEFVVLLAELGDNRAYGFDRVIRQEGTAGNTTLIKDFYGPRYGHLRPGFLCCKMTLEHVPDPVAFTGSIRATLGERSDVLVFFMIPEVTRILTERAFWDIYYEHCSYFSPGSLGRLFRRAGFDPVDLWTDYDDQYVLLAARPGAGTGPRLANEHGPEALAPEVRAFTHQVAGDQARWRGWLADLHAAGKRTVLWGGGSKAVAFLTTLGITREIEHVIDINPRRSGTFIAGSGQQIVAPEFLRDHRPDVVIIMNSIYRGEIQAALADVGVHPERIIGIETPPSAPSRH
ncbi:MAG TPA: class I SAM-dependent methyltransferase [Geminicoccaceae bacterium]|nr:class I SAM-dependent methyltransferase [Geminicoccaceae bacterium]